MLEILIIIVLLLINGIFAMAEIAVVSARKSKLSHMAADGDLKAKAALDLLSSPSRFLSTVQIGITLVGIFAGAFGGAKIAGNLSDYLDSIAFIAPYSDAVSLGIVVTLITYFSLILGELVPKRIALSNPEKIASMVAIPMNKLSRITSPLVSLLSFSSDIVFRLLGLKDTGDPVVSDEEVRMLLREGTRAGVFTKEERDIVERTLRLGDKKVGMLMTPRKEIVWIDIDSPFKTIRQKITKKPHSHFPICKNNIDKVLGVVRVEDMLVDFLTVKDINIEKSLHKPLFIPESMDCLKLLEMFKKTGIHLALISDEYGNTKGLISLSDLLEDIVGDIPTVNEIEESEIIKRDDGSFLVDGLVSTDDFKEHFHIRKLPGEKAGNFHTLGGFVTSRIGRIPVSSDKFEAGDFRFEVVDMDGNRVDKVLITSIKRRSKRLK